MSIYIFNFITFYLYEIIIPKIKNRDKIITIVIGMQLLLLSCLRNISVGVDLGNYIPRFYIINETRWRDLFNIIDVVDFEFGYILFNKIVGIIYNNERFLLIIVSVIIVLRISKFIYYNSKIKWLSFFLFVTLGFWGNSLNIIRQFIAIAILLPAVNYITENKLKKFILNVIIAAFIHKTALIFLILYPLSKVKITKRYIFVVASICIILSKFSVDIINLIANFFNYNFYINDIGNGLGNGKGMFILLSSVLIVALIYKKYINEKDKNFNIYIHMIIISIVFNTLAFNFALMGRVMHYFTISMIILIPNVIFYMKEKIDKYIATYLVAFLSIYYYIFIILQKDLNVVVPYKFVWQ